MKAIRSIWEILTQRDDKPTQVALAICVIVFSSVIGCAAAFLYGFSARSGGGFESAIGGFVAILACVGAFSVGGMLGLLFGSPTMGSGQIQAKSPNAESNASFGVRPNTSLERVADWLTTMIVGLGLVNLGAIKEEAAVMSVWLTQAITGTTSPNGSPGIAIALGFSFSGFLLLYLWCMRFLPSELRDSYDALRARAEDAEAQAQRLLTEFKEKTSFRVPQENLEQLAKRLTEAGVEEDISKEVVVRYKMATRADNEPMQDFGPAQSQGYSLSASIEDAGARKFNVKVQLAVPDGTPAKSVFWLLHNTFAPDVLSECPIKHEGASYTTTVDEPFVIGCVVPIEGQASVQLSLSLADVPGAPSGFLPSQ